MVAVLNLLSGILTKLSNKHNQWTYVFNMLCDALKPSKATLKIST